MSRRRQRKSCENSWRIGLEDGVHDISWGNEKGQRNDNVETEKHGSFEIVGLSILDGVSDDKDGDGKGDGLD